MLKKTGAWIKRHPIWSVLIALLASFIIWQIIKPRTLEYEYTTEKASRGDVNRVVSASGKLRALNTINVGSEVSGQVTNVYVDFNSQVTAGQVLAEIDPTRARARVQQSRAQVSLTQATLQQAQANVARARNDVVIQQRDYNRRSTLAKQGFLSKAALDTADAQLNAAKTTLRVGITQISSAQAQIRQANAELSSANLDLRRTKIVAPVSGVIINKLVEPGSTVTAGFQTPNLFEIAADITKMQVEASVDEADIGQVKEGQNVSFTVDSYPDDIFRAKVRQVRQAALETQNIVSYLVILDVDNLEGKLLPGMTANVEIITGSKPDILRVPNTALRFRPRAADMPESEKKKSGERGPKKKKRQAKVFIATSDPYKPKARKVTAGLAGDEYTEITGGLKVGETILLRSKSLKPKPEAEEVAEDDSAS